MTPEELEFYNRLDNYYKEYYNFISRMHPEWEFEQKVKRTELQIQLDSIGTEIPITNEFLKDLFKKTDRFMKNHLSSDLYNKISPNFQKAISWLDNAINKGIDIIEKGIDAILEKFNSL